MGWSKGSDVMEYVMVALKDEDEDIRRKLYRTLIPAMEQCDWDTQDECLGYDPIYDQVLTKLHPEWELDE